MDIYALVALVLFSYFTILFIVAQILKNNSIVDSFWGPGFLLVALFTSFNSPSLGIRAALVTALVAIWATRLFMHITVRNWGKPEDPRYVDMRAKWGTHNPMLKAFINVFMVQGVLLYIIALPIISSNTNAVQTPSTLMYLGVVVWIIGFIFESLGDAQLKAFISDPANRGKIMTTGLWRFTRHPNYFGEAMMWWGIFLISVTDITTALGVVSPLTITYLLVFVSGIPLVEKMWEGRADFAEYASRTNAFFPWLPRKKG